MIPTTSLYRPRRVRVCSWLSRCISPEVVTRADNNPNILAELCRLLRCQMVPTCFMMFYAQNSVSKAPPAWMPESLSDYSKSVRECTKCSHRKMSNPPGPCRGTLALKYNEDTSTFQWKLRQLRGLERFKRYHRNRRGKPKEQSSAMPAMPTPWPGPELSISLHPLASANLLLTNELKCRSVGGAWSKWNVYQNVLRNESMMFANHWQSDCPPHTRDCETASGETAARTYFQHHANVFPGETCGKEILKHSSACTYV